MGTAIPDLMMVDAGGGRGGRASTWSRCFAAIACSVTMLVHFDFASVPEAHANRRVSFPQEMYRRAMRDGTVVAFRRIRESVVVNGSVGGTVLHRNAMVTGKYSVRTSRVVDNLEIVPGYIVGCQVRVDGASGEAGAGIDADVVGAAGLGAELSLGPGQVRRFYLIDAERANPFGGERHEVKIRYPKSDRGTLSYVNSQLSLRGCAGYAQARSFVNVTVETEFATLVMSFYGMPFSLG